MAVLRTILLAFVVCFANAYCACADMGGASTGQPPRSESSANSPHTPAPSHTGCQGACHGSPTDRAPCPSNGHSHGCGHCTGTVTADTAAKTVVPPLLDMVVGTTP